MKKIYYYLLLTLIAFSCINKNSNNITPKEKPTVEKRVQVRQFPSDKNLFLDFFAGMSHEEIKEILKRKIGKSEFFIRKSSLKDYWRIDKNHLFSLTNENVDSLTIFNGFDRIYYQFSNGQKTVYARVDFEFPTYSSLGSITLVLPDYKPRNETNVRTIEREFEEGKILSNSIKQMYEKKYGKPVIEVGQKNKMNELFYKVMDAEHIYNRNINYFEDIYRYRNNNDNKLVSITSSLKNVNIKYSLYSDYLQNIKEEEKKLENQKNKEDNTYQKTLESI